MTKTLATIDIANLTVAFHIDEDTCQIEADTRDHFYVAGPQDLEELSGPVQVALYNATASELASNIAQVNKFTNKNIGATRLWANLEDLREVYLERQQAVVEKNAKAEKPARATGTNLAPKATIYACRAGSKQSILVDMLNREQGATMAELIEALSGGNKPWTEVSVKSGLSWDMNKIKGYGIRTTKRGDADCFHLVLPAGIDAPVPHAQRKG